MLRAILLAFALSAMAGAARGDIVDRIDILPAEGEAEVRVGLTFPVHYLNHFPRSSGEIIEMMFEVASLDAKGAERNSPPLPEIKRSPRSALVPPFTITWNPLLTDVKPKATDADRETLRLVLQFERPVEFRVVEGRDSRSFSLFLKRKPADAGDKK